MQLHINKRPGSTCDQTHCFLLDGLFVAVSSGGFPADLPPTLQ